MTQRTLITTYYGPGRNKPVVKTNRSSNREEVGPNIQRHMQRNQYGAVVATVHDEETTELLLVATYHIGSKFAVMYEADVTKPICVTNIEG